MARLAPAADPLIVPDTGRRGTTAIFDLDGTLARRDTFLPFLRRCLRAVGRRNASVLTLPLVAGLGGLGVLSRHDAKERFLAAVLGGVAVSDIDPVVESFTWELLHCGMNASAMRALETHLAQGDRVVIATASFDIYVLPLARLLGVGAVVCTSAEIENGRFSGRITGDNCRGAEKVRRLESLGPEPLHWQAAVVYTDHHADLPLVQRAGRAVLVRPGFVTRLRMRRVPVERLAESS